MNSVTRISLSLLILGSSLAFAEDSVSTKTQEMEGTTQQERVRTMNQEREQLEDKNEDGDSQIRHKHRINQMNQDEKMNQIRTQQQDMRMGKEGTFNPPKK